MKPEPIRRYLPLSAGSLRLEHRTAGEVKTPVITGYASVFNTEVEIWDGYFEMVSPGAYAKSIAPAGDDIRALFNHDPSQVLGRNRAGTLLLQEDAQGLRMECTPPDTQQARDICTLISRGDVTGMSFTFDLLSQKWEKRDDGTYHRTLLECRLYDVGPVTFPAYPSTTAEVTLRSREQLAAEAEAWLRAANPPPAGMPIACARRRLGILKR